MNKFLFKYLHIILIGLFIGVAIEAGAQSFTDVTSGSGLESIPIRGRSCVNWVDYNNDGFLDLFVVGDTIINAEPGVNKDKIFRVYKNNSGNGTFTDVSATVISGVDFITAANFTFADYNNDGAIDFACIGVKNKGGAVITSVYKNSGFPNYSYSKIGTVFNTVHNGVVVWGDYNHDGRIDLFLTGNTSASVIRENNGAAAAYLYKNEGNDNFSLIKTFPKAAFGSGQCANFADINGDGYLDVSLYSYTGIREFYINNKVDDFKANTISTLASSAGAGSHVWGDFDNDGTNELLFAAGETNQAIRHCLWNATETVVSKIGTDYRPKGVDFQNTLNSLKIADYNNDGLIDMCLNKGGIRNSNANNWVINHDSVLLYKNVYTIGIATAPFVKDFDFPGSFIKNAYPNGQTFGDYDNDGKIDLIIPSITSDATPKGKVFLFKNGVATTNGAPSAPTLLTPTVSGDDVALLWNKAIDDLSPKLTYDIRIGSAPGKTDVMASLSDLSTGYRKVPAFGIANDTTTSSNTTIGYMVRNLPAGTYYWSVQGVDGAYRGGAWATEGSFTISAQQASNIVLTNVTSSSMTISWTNGSEANRAVFMKALGSYMPYIVDSAITANSVFGTTGSNFRTTGWYCVYAGSGSTVNVTGLTASTPYTIAVLEYSGSGATIKYNTSTATGNPYNLKVNQTITFNALVAKNFGDANFGLTATGGASGLAIVYSSSNTAVATVSGSTVTIVGAGSTDITANQGSNLSYNAATPVIQTLTVNKKAQNLTFGALAAKTMGNAPFDLAAVSGGSSSAITYVSSNTSVATISGKTVTIVGAGTSDITASQLGDANYLDATPVMQTLTVNKGAQIITFGALATKSLSDPAFDLTATGGGSANPIVYTSSNTAVATISGKTVTIVGEGTTDITANQSGDANYLDATPVIQQLTIAALPPQTITFNTIPTKVFGDAAFDLSATGGASGNPVTFVSANTSIATISGKTVTIVGAGDVDITASQAGNASYAAATPVIKKLTVTKATQTITFGTLANKVFGDAAFNLSATGGGSGNSVTYTSSNTSVATISGNTVTLVGVGSTNITASQLGNANYSDATPVIQSLTVTKLLQTITFNALSAKTFGDAPFNISATGGASGNAVTFTSSNTAVATISGNTVTIIGAGTTNITANQAGNANYENATAVVQALTVNKISQTITFNTLATKTVGDPTFTLSATGGASGNAVTFTSSNTAVATISGNTVTIVGGGTTDITANQLGNSNYENATAVIKQLTVNKLSQTIVFNALSAKTMGDAAFTLSATGGASGNGVTYTSSNTNVATISGNTVTIVGGGTADITASQSGNSQYNDATPVVRTLTVNKTTQTITFASLVNKKYSDGPITLGATSTSNLPITYSSSDNNIATIDGNSLIFVGIGTVTIKASQAGNNSYTAATDVTHSITISKGVNVITFNTIPVLKTDSTDYKLTAVASSGLKLTYECSDTSVAVIKNLSSGDFIHAKSIGTATIKVTQSGSDLYEPAVAVTQALTVTAPTAIEDPVIRGFKLYPNPVGDKLSFEFTETFSKADLNIYTSSGAVVITKNLVNSFTEISTKELPTGMYIVKILVNNKLAVKKIMKR